MKTIQEAVKEYKKPEVLAQSTKQMAECRPNTKPSGRPCCPIRPGGRINWYSDIEILEPDLEVGD